MRLDRGAGVVAFFGETQFSDGLWVGIILDETNGKNNGSVKDVKYFECEENYGTFVRPNTVHLEKTGRPTLSSGLPRPNARRTTNVSKTSSTATSVRSSPAVSILNYLHHYDHAFPANSESQSVSFYGTNSALK